MKLMTIDEYRETCYTAASKPSRRKLIRLIKDGVLHGKKHGKVYYINIEAEENYSGNPLVDKVLQTT